jgi:hypothetical protein
MKHARLKAASAFKQAAGPLAQMMAVIAMLFIAGFVFYVR